MIVSNFKNLYTDLNKGNIYLLDNLYANDIIFIDPFNRIEGIASLKQYFSKLYQNVKQIQFNFVDFNSKNEDHFITWEMKIIHHKLNSKKEFTVFGATHLKSNEVNKITYHRDYFDAGSLIYERVPVIKQIISWLKNKL